MAVSNVYLFIGEEKFIINTKINRIVKETNADEFNITAYDCEEVDVQNAIQDALTLPFMCDNKVVIIKNPLFLVTEKTQISHHVKSLIDYLQKPMESTCLIIDASLLRLNEKLEVVKTLRKKAVVNETKSLGDIEFGGWLKRQCDLNGSQIRDDAVKAFYNVVGKDLINAKTEVDKLICYVDGGVITKEIVDLVCTKEIQNDIYSLSNAILARDREKTISTYLDLISVDNDVNRLLNLVSKTIRENIIVNAMLKQGYKQADVATKMRVTPNRAYFLVKNARGISLDVAQNYLMQLGDLDYKIKSGQVDAKTGFEFFIFNTK